MISMSRAEILEFAAAQLACQQPRDDYREVLQLTVIYLGGIPARGISFRAPGAAHRARWMAKSIYALKMSLFRGQFKMTTTEEKAMCDIAVFTVLVYVRAWMTAAVTVEAPLNDFRLMGQLLQYSDTTIAAVTSKKFGLHLSYLSEDLIALALFDSRVPLEMKKMMIAAMKHPASTCVQGKHLQIDPAVFLSGQGLEQFCSPKSKRLFHKLKLPCAFLNKNPSEWSEDDEYKQALVKVQGLAVVNDRAERGVALIQSFNKKLTRGEEQLQFLLQVVTEHRRCFPDCKKETFLRSRQTH
jgi:hypothetical protein